MLIPRNSFKVLCLCHTTVLSNMTNMKRVKSE
jgi:hypothetical protein